MNTQILTKYIYCLPEAVKQRSVRFDEYEIVIESLTFSPKQEQYIDQVQKMNRLKQKRHAYAIPRKLSHIDGFKSQKSIWIEIKYYWQKFKSKRAEKVLRRELMQWEEAAGNQSMQDVTPEIVLCQELQKKIPREIWTSRMRDAFPRRVHEAYCMFLLRRFLEETANKRRVAIYIALAKEDNSSHFIENRMHQIMELVKNYQSHLSDLIFFSTNEAEIEYMDALLEGFEEETGIAACCYEAQPSIILNMHSLTDQMYLVADFYGMNVNEICGTQKHELYYLDGIGSKSRKEIRRMNAKHIHVKSLVNSLDRGFVGGL